MLRYFLYFICAILSVTPTIGFTMSDPIPAPIAIYSEDCGPDDAPVTRINIPEPAINNAFCQSIGTDKANPQNIHPLYATGNFHITVHSSAQFWSGKKIEGDILKKYVWLDMCGVHPSAITPDSFEMLSVQYLEQSAGIQLRYRLNGKEISKILKLQDSGEKRPICG